MMPLLVGLDGIGKIPRSRDSYVGINEAPNEVFGKLMGIPDDLMWVYYTLLSFRPLAEVDLIRQETALGRNPHSYKVILTQKIVVRFHSQIDTERALEDSDRRAHGGMSGDIPQIELPGAPLGIAQLLERIGFCLSTSSASRNTGQSGMKIDDTAISNRDLEVGAGTLTM